MHTHVEERMEKIKNAKGEEIVSVLYDTCLLYRLYWNCYLLKSHLQNIVTLLDCMQ